MFLSNFCHFLMISIFINGEANRKRHLEMTHIHFRKGILYGNKSLYD